MIPARKKLFGPARTPLEVMGQFQGDLKYHGKESKQTVYVVKGLKTNLLGLPAIMDLNLVALIGETNTTHADTIYDQFPSLFQGIGNIGEPYHIQLKDDAKPYALFTTRNVPLPLRTKNGGGSQKEWVCAYLRGSETIEQQCTERKTSSSYSGRYSSSALRSKSVLQA